MTNELALNSKNEIETAEKLSIDVDVYRALKYSLFPEASDLSIGMYVAYCRAKNYDLLRKPMHIVPMNCKTNKKDSEGKFIYEKRDIVMPGIPSYRIDAMRTGQFYGISEPEFGPMITQQMGKGNIKVTYPEWCKIIIYKKIGNDIREIPAKLYWIECYASKDHFTDEPNAMWKKRPRAMLEKCCEALAFRKGFPEETGGLPTSEEMEGRSSMDDLPGEKDITSQSSVSVTEVPTFSMDKEILQKHLDIINNTTDMEILKVAYNSAKSDAIGDKNAINEILKLTKDRRVYISQLSSEKEKQKSNEEFLKEYDGESK